MAAQDLESSVILRDESTATINRIAANSEKMNQSLLKTQAAADRASSALRRMGQDSARSNLGDLGGAGLGNAVDLVNDATDATGGLEENLFALGKARLSPSLLSGLADLQNSTDSLSDRTRQFSEELSNSNRSAGGLARTLAALDNSPLRLVPGVSELASVSQLANLLPAISGKAIALAGSLGLVTAGVYGAYTGFNALLDKMDDLETKSAQKSKISFFGDPDQAITDVQDALQDRLSKDGTLSFLLKVDSTSALADIHNFESVATAVQAHADKFGTDWQGALDIAIAAIQAGDGEALERLGVIKDANRAYRNYAEAIGKTVQQLTPLERQQALANAVVSENNELVKQGPSAIDAMNAAQERLRAKLADGKSSIADFAVSLFAPNVENAAAWWTSKLDGITNAVDTFEENLKARTELNKLAGSLTDDQLTNWDDLNTAIDETNNSLNILRDQSLAATLQGNEQEAARIDQQIDALDRKLEGLKAQRDSILADFKAGKDPVIEEVDRPAAPAGSQVFAPTPGAILNTLTGGTDESAGRTIADLTKDQLKEVLDLQAQLEQKIAGNRAKANEVGESIASSAIDGDANRVSRMKDLLTSIETQIAKDEQLLADLQNDPALSLDPAFVAKALGPQVQADANKVAQSVDPQLIESLAGTYGGIRDAIISGANAKTEEVNQGVAGVGEQIDALTQAVLDWQNSSPQGDIDNQVFLPIISSASGVNKALDETSAKLDLVVEKFQATSGIDASGIAGGVTAQINDQVNQLANINPAGSVDPQLINALAGTYGDLTAIIVEGANQKTEEVEQGIKDTGEQIDALTQAVQAWQFSAPNLEGTDQVWNPMIQNSIQLQEELDATEKKIEDVETKATDFEKLSVRLDTGKDPVDPEAQVAPTEDAVAAYNGLTNARRESAIAAQEAGDASAAEAIQRALAVAATKDERDALVASIQLKSSQFEVINGLVAATGELSGVTTQHLIALAKVNAQTGDTIQVAGMLFDAVTGLPVAFETAGLSAAQLSNDLVGLMNQMDALQTSAIGAGFSIANRLIPALGIAGSIRQGQVWAQQVGAIRDTFDEINANRLQAGNDPLGTEVMDASLSALQANWNAQATDMIADMQDVGEGAGGMADATTQAAKQMNSALDGIISGVLKDSTQGLIPLDDLLPRRDEVDENARRMADVAVKGFQSPWFEGLKNLFPADALSGGEEAIKRFAAEMVRGHQEGLTTALYDVDAAAARVIEKIQAKSNQSDLIDQVREKVKGLAAASDLDIMEALGIDTAPERMGASMRQAATDVTLSFEQIIGELQKLGEGESPVVSIVNPKEEDLGKITEAGTTAVSLLGEAMVAQASDGAYGTRAIQAMVAQLDGSEKDMKSRGKKMADWLGKALTERFKESVPKELLDILVISLAPLMAAAAKQDAERSGGGGTN